MATITKNDGLREEIVTGKIVADGTATNVSIGFVPKKVAIINATNPSQHIWQYGMGDGYCLQVASDGTQTVVTSAGISEYDGVTSAAAGFTIGTNAVLNTNNDVLYFTAYR